MNRIAQNNKNEKFNFGRFIGFILLIIIIFGICIFVGAKIAEKVTKNPTELTNEEKIMSVDQNEVMNINDTGENIENEIENEVSENEITNNNTTTTTKKETKVTPGITDKKQEAIDLVKKEWGEDNTVNFVFDYVDSNGEYIVAVKDKTTSTVRNYFRVNLTTKNVEIDY